MFFLVVTFIKLTNSFHVVDVDLRLDLLLLHKLLFNQCGALDWSNWLDRSFEFRCEESIGFLLLD